MKFIDECNIKIKAGKGGDGIVSFRREARVARGGPDGGDGGRGGNVYFVGDTGVNTLLNIKYMQKIFAEPGTKGMSKGAYGRAGKDKFIKAPLGTLIYDKKENLIADITEYGIPILIANGGRGGRGNKKFKSSINTAPRLSENGDLGYEFEAHIVLKILADVGFIGKPSAGKSTLLTAISNAKPETAEYEFTTLTPQLGLVRVNNDSSFVAADLPGLIEGASQGKGLGNEILKHVERCRVIAHVIDFGSNYKNQIDDFEIINKELKDYKLGLENRKQVVIANKSDLIYFKDNLIKFKNKYSDIQIIEFSALTSAVEKEKNKFDGSTANLISKLYEAYLSSGEIIVETNKNEVTIELDDEVIIENIYEGAWEVSGKTVKKIYDKIPINTFENIARFNKKMREEGIWRKLIEVGVKPGDIVNIYSYQLEWSNEN
ncbi:MAG: GTPase ObgE [Mollicutes bacterium PWAP]|nr:GTPase ObgE [Mollicutes bacterium PWAP]